MCRWFAYLSETEECLLEDVLVTPAHSLSKQVHEHYLPKLLSHDPHELTTEHEITTRNRLFNVDGVGLAWYTSARADFNANSQGERPALYKDSQPPLNDTNFRSICANTATKACFAHIRAATATATTAVNNHPFVFGRHVFMHNGVVTDFLSIRRAMCELIDDDAYANISGSTDSEHFAALYMTELTNGKGKASWDEQYSTAEMKAALHKTMGTVVKLQREKLGGDRAQPNSLNVAATDGSQLVAFRCYNHAVEQPPSLYYSTKAGVTMNRKYPDHPDGKENPMARKKSDEHGRHVIVASEPSTYRKEDWILIEKNHCVMVEKNGDVVVESVEYPEEWNATVNSS
ncbi:MAG: hypothetical protein M1830_010443 [Pleopsidium flavum]|nr:MAG: hypothetical protein M1830_010443 [Pleopsidium flavum]